ncbi:MAG: M48 family metalloprotease [Acidobacteriaceae bacterium]|nr:M48 family metalloprotease [Acidobacteriaceae bacterium]
MRNKTKTIAFVVIFLTIPLWSSAQEESPSGTPAVKAESADSSELATPAPSSESFNQVIDRVVEREHSFVAQMRHMHPLLETYIQNLKNNHDHNLVPVSDEYFLGRLDTSNGIDNRWFMKQPGFGKRFLNRLMLDEDFQKNFYDFTFVRREFLGEVRCLVIDVQPKNHMSDGRFLGRIWVEDQDYNIVRINGTYSPNQRNSYLHFDSWRLNLRPGVWLPAYIYSEESDSKLRNNKSSQTPHFKAQTRLWDYDQQRLAYNQEFTQIQVDSLQTVRDQSESAQDATPIEAERAWERQAEENAVERLQKIGLLAPPGDVDKVLQTVVNNLIVTNNLTNVPDVRCRVLLTEPFESFTIGRTIVVSRGLLDVLPDEASLAMVLAHELSHIALGHRFDTNLAFNDRLFFPDEKTFERLDFTRDAVDEEAADQRALSLLAHSPYKDKLSTAGLFLEALQTRAPELKHLIRPHLGNSLAGGKSIRMSALLSSAPQLEMRRVDQIAALPLGGRVRLDPWSNRVELLKAKPVALLSAREKMPFEVTPFFPYVTRLQPAAPDKVAVAPLGQQESATFPAARE